MEKEYKETAFVLEEAVERIRHLLPAQGPIKDFIHHNTLHGFQHYPFGEGVEKASRFYKAHAYLPLQDYRKAYEEKRIAPDLLEKAIEKTVKHTSWAQGTFVASLSLQAFVKEALLHWVPVKDFPSFTYLCPSKEWGALGKSLLPYSTRAKLTGDCRQGCEEQLGYKWDKALHPILFRLLANYLDQGIGFWKLPGRRLSFFPCVRQLIRFSVTPLAPFINKKRISPWLCHSPREVVLEMLKRMVGQEHLYEAYLTDSLMAHPGWSGMVATLEGKESTLLRPRKIQLLDFIAVKLLLEWELIQESGIAFVPVASYHAKQIEEAERVFSNVYFLSNLLSSPQEIGGMSKEQWVFLFSLLTPTSLGRIWHEALEESYYRNVLNGIHTHALSRKPSLQKDKKVQAVFCIDDRECSYRRYLEELDPRVETFATAGFFGLDYYFQSLNDAYPVKLCPVPVQPKHLIKELPAQGFEREYEQQKRRTQKTALSLHRLQDASSSLFLGFIAANTLGHLSFLRLVFSFLRPASFLRFLQSKKIDIPTQLSLLREGDTASEGLFIGFTVEEMANRVEGVLRGIGLVENFSPLIVMVAHGSSSINNPHFAAYDCGACSGRPGAPNARVFAAIANLPQVRERLKEKGIDIPEKTRFLGAYHDTCTDKVEFFDAKNFTTEQKGLFEEFYHHTEIVKSRNAKERCRRFALVDLDISPEKAAKEAMKRSVALFEPRPELGHATNSLCIVGRRSLTQNLFLDRRSFLNSYEPAQDPEGQILNQILSAVIPVCGGINLEYFFSRMDNGVYGCGTKLSHNVCSLLGVYNGIDDDLRTGLPVQMIELHEPIRLLTIIEQNYQIVQKVIANNSSIRGWIENAWVKVACIDPHTQKVMWFSEEEGFVPFKEEHQALPHVQNSFEAFRCSRGDLPLQVIGV